MATAVPLLPPKVPRSASVAPSHAKGWKSDVGEAGAESPTTRPQLLTPRALLCAPPSVLRSVTV
jgi:hypothetical protein